MWRYLTLITYLITYTNAQTNNITLPVFPDGFVVPSGAPTMQIYNALFDPVRYSSLDAPTLRTSLIVDTNFHFKSLENLEPSKSGPSGIYFSLI
jgi:hypothetical protein